MVLKPRQPSALRASEDNASKELSLVLEHSQLPTARSDLSCDQRPPQCGATRGYFQPDSFLLNLNLGSSSMPFICYLFGFLPIRAPLTILLSCSFLLLIPSFIISSSPCFHLILSPFLHSRLLLYSLFPILLTSPGLSSPSILHNRCGCNASQPGRHDEAASDTQSETERVKERRGGRRGTAAPQKCALLLRSNPRARTDASTEYTHTPNAHADNRANAHAHIPIQAKLGWQPGA